MNFVKIVFIQNYARERGGTWKQVPLPGRNPLKNAQNLYPSY